MRISTTASDVSGFLLGSHSQMLSNGRGSGSENAVCGGCEQNDRPRGNTAGNSPWPHWLSRGGGTHLPSFIKIWNIVFE